MSRRAAEDCITAGRVTVNGRIARLGDQVEDTDEIRVDGQVLPQTARKVYIMLNKPRGYVTTLRDEKGRRDVTQLLRGVTERVYPVGRLDMDSEGLLLMTDDGDFANRVMHPSHEVDKTYLTWVRGDALDAAVGALGSPMTVDGYPVRPAAVVIRERFEDGGLLEITIHEGRNRQVRKMCAQAGLRVTRLVRIAEGGLRLSGLKSGSWRYLTPEEVHMLMHGQERE